MIVILVDTLRADHLSAHGRNRPTSPNLDRIAGKGVLFENAFAHSNWTPPSTATLLTSLYESVHGVNQVKGFVPNEITSLAEVLGQAGYTSAFWSANTLVGARNNYTQGFDYTDQISEAYQAIKGRNQLPSYQLYAWRTIASRSPTVLQVLGGLNGFFESLINEVGLDMGNPVEVDEGLLVNSVKTWAGYFRARKADWMYERVRAYLSYMTARPGYDPRRNKFFLYLHYFDPHTPYRPPGAYKRRFDPGFKGRLAPLKPGGKKVCRQAGGGAGAGGCSVEWFPGKGDPPLRPRELENMVAQYDGEILFLDRFVGKLVGRLKKTGLFENTLLLITSDHGEAFWEHKQYGHGQTVYQEEVHIPLMVTWPRRLRSGLRVRDPVGLVDIMPTLLEAAGIPPVPCMQGRSFWKVMLGKARRREVYGETTDYDHAKLFLVRDHLKLIYELEGLLSPARSYRVRKRLLFDLRDDPGERKNLLGPKGAGNPPVREAESLQASMDRWYKTVRRPCRFYQPSEADTSKDIEDRLKALGYID